ncbi:M48 family metallopeptidase [Thiomonas sp.]
MLGHLFRRVASDAVYVWGLLAGASALPGYTSLVYLVAFAFGYAFLSRWLTGLRQIRRIRRQAVPDTHGVQARTDRLAQLAGVPAPQVLCFSARRLQAATLGFLPGSGVILVQKDLPTVLPDLELEAILGHELGHIAHGDVFRRSVLQGLANMAALSLGYGVFAQFQAQLGTQDALILGLAAATGVLLGMAAWVAPIYQHRQEFEADIFGARLSSAPAMASALRRMTRPNAPRTPNSLHPCLEDRVNQLQSLGGYHA